MLKPIIKTRIAEEVVKQIKELIKNQNMTPGSRLPSERTLMEQFQVSRSSVREALRMLEIMGIVEVKPGSGIFVKQLSEDFFTPLSSWLSDQKETLYNHFEARLVLEPRAAAFAAERADPHIIKKLKSCLLNFKKKIEDKDIVGAIKEDMEFHRLVAVATKNKTLMLLMDTVTKFLFEGWKATLRIPGRLEKTVIEHGAILEAIEKKSPESATQAMRAHLENAFEDLRKAGLE